MSTDTFTFIYTRFSYFVKCFAYIRQHAWWDANTGTVDTVSKSDQYFIR